MTTQQVLTVADLAHLPTVTTVMVPFWDGHDRAGEVHRMSAWRNVRVVIYPELRTLGALIREPGYDRVEFVIALREWNQTVLLHEVLHVFLPDDHKIINAVEVALAQYVTFPASTAADAPSPQDELDGAYADLATETRLAEEMTARWQSAEADLRALREGCTCGAAER